MNVGIPVRTIVAGILVAACSGGSVSPSPAPSASAAPTIAPTPVPTPIPTLAPVGVPFDILPADPPVGFTRDITCTGEIGASDPVALVQLQDTNPDDELEGDVVVRDYADASASRTLCTFGPSANPYTTELLDNRHLVIQTSTEESGNRFAIVDLPGVTYRWFAFPKLADGGWGPQLLAVSPALDRIVWKDVHAGGRDIDEIHVATDAGDTVVATLPDTNQGRCGTPEDSNEGAFSSDGTHVYVLNQPIPMSNSLLVLAGDAEKLSIVAPKGDWGQDAWPAMAVWSPLATDLYFRQGTDVWHWTPADGKSLALPGIRWSRPTISADGRFIAYEAGPVDGARDVYLLDNAGVEDPVKVGEGGSEPAFLDARHLWLVRDRGPVGCEGGAEPRFVIRDVTTGAETPSDILRVFRVWPATSSNY